MPDGPGLRTFTTALAHRPLQGTWAERFLYILGLQLDETVEKLTQGTHDHMVTECDASALQFLGSERGIQRGLTESDDSYRARLQRALDDLALAGNPWSVLSQVLGYVLATTPRALTVQTTYTSAGAADVSTWDYYETDEQPPAAPRHLADTSGGFNWDQRTPTLGSWGWWRWYLIVSAVAPNDWIEPFDTWGSSGFTWGESGMAWGVNAPRTVGLSLKVIVAQWKPAGPTCHWIIITFNDALFIPGQPEGGGVNPDGYFGRWAKLSGGVYVRSRFSDARYFRGPVP